MKYEILGRTGLNVSVIGLGGGGDSRLGVQRDEYQGTRLVQVALEHGVNFIDTAEAYGTEAAIGRALRGVRRDQVVISTKKTTLDSARLEPADVAASLDASLRRLGTDYVDVYHLHGVTPEDYAVLRERVVPTLLELRRLGKIRFLGIIEKFATDPGHRMLERALEDDIWDVVMVGFNLLNQSARERVFPKARARNVGTLIMFAVRRALSHPERLRALLGELTERGAIDRDAAREGLEFLLAEASSLPEAAYRYCRHEPGVHVTLSGTSNEAHLLENIASLAGPPLSLASRERLQRLFAQIDDISGQ